MKTPDHKRAQNDAWKANNRERVVHRERWYHLRVRSFVRLNRRTDARIEKFKQMVTP